MKRAVFVASALAASVARASAAEVGFNLVTPTGTVFGTLATPARTRPPVVLIIAGSGPTDRDGNDPGGLNAAPYRLLAADLATNGMASLRYDKRGIGMSAPAMTSESALRFDDYLDDASAWIAKLAADGRFGSVAVAGHSEGSLIGMIAAQRTRCAAFVSLAGAGFPAADVLRRQLADQLATQPALAAANERILTELVAGRSVADVPEPLLPLYRPAIQPYLIAWFRYDPRVEIAKLTMPCAVVQGTNDFQVSVDDARALAAAQPRAKLDLIDGMTHMLKDSPLRSASAQISTVYRDPAIPLDPAVARAIVDTFR